jgi:hypothetical protein
MVARLSWYHVSVKCCFRFITVTMLWATSWQLIASDIETYWSALLAAVTLYNNVRCDLWYEHAKRLKQINTMVHVRVIVCVCARVSQIQVWKIYVRIEIETFYSIWSQKFETRTCLKINRVFLPYYSKHIVNVFDQRVARQQLSKHDTLRNNRGSCIVCDQLLGYATPRQTDFRTDAMTSQSNGISYHMTCFRCCPCSAYIMKTWLSLS